MDLKTFCLFGIYTEEPKCCISSAPEITFFISLRLTFLWKNVLMCESIKFYEIFLL